jgi:hypothetical protein
MLLSNKTFMYYETRLPNLSRAEIRPPTIATIPNK